MNTERIVARAPATLSHRFSATGASGVTVTATDADGTTVLDSVPADAPPDGGDRWTVKIPPAEIQSPTRLTVEWDAGSGWVETDVVDVAGGRYLTPGDVRAGDEEGRGLNRERFTEELLEAAIIVVERRIEQATGVAWVPRYERLDVTVAGGNTVRLRPAVREVLELIVGGRETDPARLQVTPYGTAFLANGTFPMGGNAVAFIHGHDRPPADLANAAREAAAELAKGQANSRVPKTADSVSAGGYAFNFSHQADAKRGRPFGLPDVDAVIMSHAAAAPAVA